MKNGEEQHILQKNLARFLVKEIFNMVSEEDLLRIVRSKSPVKSDIWYFKGEELPTVQVETLKSQAKGFKDSVLWDILKRELHWHAQQKGLEKSQTESDLIAAKVMLFIVDVIDSKLKSMSQ
jgi:hypothetical protein